MSDFDVISPPFRLAQTNYGDDLQSIAAREMGDANRWPELVWLNDLSPPYITNAADVYGPDVIVAGGLIRVPASTSLYTDDADTGQVYERDVRISNGRLVINEDGDLDVVSGTENLVQQLRHRINTPRGQLRRHPEYGCLIWRLQGGVSGPVANALAAEYVKSTLLSDYRVSTVNSVDAVVTGDAIRVVASAEAIAGGGVDVVT